MRLIASQSILEFRKEITQLEVIITLSWMVTISFGSSGFATELSDYLPGRSETYNG